MGRLIRWIQHLIQELRRRQVIRVAVVYATTGFIILQLAEILVDPFGLGPWALRLITLVLLLGFPLAVGLAWVYNLTDKGVVEVEDEVPPQHASRRSAFTSNGLIVGLLVLVAGLLLYPRIFFPEDGSSAGPAAAPDTMQVHERSIAVLPFEALGKDEPGIFTEGMHDDLLTRLANISGLTVISRTSVERFRGTELAVPTIADSLGVRWVLEGGVQEMGNQIQVNAQLIDPRRDVHAWADSYRRDRTSRDLFAIQTEITKKIARSMEAHLTSGELKRVERRPTENLEAYRFYVQGRQHLRNVVENEEAVEDFRRALRQDSTFALAWAGVAAASARLGSWGEDLPGSDRLLSSPEEGARRALRLAPNLGEAHASLGYVHYLSQEGPAALGQLENALKLKPGDAQAHYWMGNLLAALGRPEEALSHQQRSVQLNPLAPDAQDALADAYIYVGKYEEALRQARKARDVQPEAFRTITEDIALLHLRRGSEVFEGLGVGIPEDSPSWLGMRVQAELQEGDTTGARTLFQRLKARSDPWDRAHAYAALRDIDSAFSALQEVDWPISGARVATLRYLYPRVLGPLRADPRYETLIQEINRAWGLKPDGTIPAPPGKSTGPRPETGV